HLSVYASYLHYHFRVFLLFHPPTPSPPLKVRSFTFPPRPQRPQQRRHGLASAPTPLSPFYRLRQPYNTLLPFPLCLLLPTPNTAPAPGSVFHARIVEGGQHNFSASTGKRLP